MQGQQSQGKFQRRPISPKHALPCSQNGATESENRQNTKVALRHASQRVMKNREMSTVAFPYLQHGLLAHALEVRIIAFLDRGVALSLALADDGGIVALQFICHHSERVKRKGSKGQERTKN